MLNFKWSDGSEHDFDALAPNVREIFVKRAVSHIAGNEVAASVTQLVRKAICGESGRKPAEVTSEEIKVFREAQPEQVKAWTEAEQASKIAAILDGTLNIRESNGTAVDPLTKLMHRLATEEIQMKLEAAELKLPRGDETIVLKGRAIGRQELVERQLQMNEENLLKKAKSILAAKAREKAKLAESMGSESVAESLGL